jgi:hypothetical protein
LACLAPFPGILWQRASRHRDTKDPKQLNPDPRPRCLAVHLVSTPGRMSRVGCSMRAVLAPGPVSSVTTDADATCCHAHLLPLSGGRIAGSHGNGNWLDSLTVRMLRDTHRLGPKFAPHDADVRTLGPLERKVPELLDELHGIAAGAEIDHPDLLDLNVNTDVAYARACELATQRHDSISMHDILRTLSDHAEPPVQSICRHPTPDQDGATYAAAIICPQDRRMWVLFGNPCEGIQAVGVPGE